MRATRALFASLLGRRLPKYDGRVEVNCHQRVELRRDSHGVAYVDAQNEVDAWFGLGFCHAQDRAWQLELTLRIVRGTLAEVIGSRGVDMDRMARVIGFRRAASAQWETLGTEEREQIQAYCDGINAALFDVKRRPAHELSLLRCRASAWGPSDVLGFGAFMSCMLPSNWDLEVARLLVLLNDGEQALAALDPGYRAGLPLVSPPGRAAVEAANYLARDLELWRSWMGRAGGSNAWAVNARLSANGHPLLANDPHLRAALPNVGYLARVKCNSFAVAGVSVVGAPAFITGHNGHAAWGATAALVDNSDLFLEQIGADGRSVREGDGFVPCEVRQETIRVKGQKPVELEVLTTRRGPIVASMREGGTDIFEPSPLDAKLQGQANALSLSATWLAARPTKGVLALHKVRSFEDFRGAFAQSAGCSFGMIYADADDNIGWLLGVEAPVRKSGFGSFPLPGWHDDVGWEKDPIPSDQLPYLKNPDMGLVSCANNKPVDDGTQPVFLGHDFLDGYRQRRIVQELATRGDWTVPGMARLQMDVHSGVWQEVRETVLALSPLDEDGRVGLELLGSWDGHVKGTSSAASVFELLMAEICQRVCRLKAPNSQLVPAGQGMMKIAPGSMLNTRLPSFISRLITEQPQGYFASWPETLSGSLSSVIASLRKRFGSQPESWQWGRLRPLEPAHLMAQQAPFDRVFSVGVLAGYGDSTTVNQASLEFHDPLAAPTVTAQLRSVIDLGDFAASRFVLLGGQSGNPASKHYQDLVEPWRRGEGVPIYFSDEEVRSESQHCLRLEPSAALGDRS